MISNILDKLNEGLIVVNKAYEIQFCNYSVLKHLKYSMEELQDISVEEILGRSSKSPREEIEYDMPKLWTLVDSLGERMYIQGKVVEEEWKGEKAYWLIIHEYKPYSVEALERILENIPYGVWLRDKEGNIQYINHNGKRVYSKIFDDNKIKGSRNIINWIRKGRYSILQVPLVDEDGQVKDVIGVVKYAVKQSDIDYILRKEFYYKQKEKEKIIAYKNDELIKTVGAEGILICKYNKEKSKLNGICRISSFSNYAVNKVEIDLSESMIYEAINSKSDWELNEFCKQFGTPERTDLIALGIKYIYKCPIMYNDELIGVIIVTYKEYLNNTSMEREAIDWLSKYIGAALKNNQITQEMRNELAKKNESEEKLRGLLDIVTEFVIVNDENGNFLEGNFDEWKPLGWNYEELVQTQPDGTKKVKYIEHVLEDDVEITKEVFRTILEGKKDMEFTNRWYCKEGGYKWIRWKVKYSEEKRNFLTIGSDVSEIIKMKNERLLYEETIKLEGLKRNFLSTISHELRTPINVIYSAFQLIEEESAKAEGEKKLWYQNQIKHKEMIKQNIFRLIRLTNNMLDISEIKTGDYHEKKENYNIIELIENTTMAVVPYARKKGIEIIFDTQDEEVILACNDDMIERIMLNLLSNAVKYTESGGDITVEVSREKQNLMVSVTDTGIGIPKQNLEGIFNQFELVDTSFTRRCEGTGIGLAVVKAFVEAHQGRIYAQSEVGQGSKFSFEIPIKVIEGEEIHKLVDTKVKDEKCRMEFAEIYY